MEALNTSFPGRPNYTGPTSGWFGLLHHDRLCERSHNVIERIRYVKDKKPAHEIPTRLYNMISLTALTNLLRENQDKCDALFWEFQSKQGALTQEFQSNWELNNLNQEFKSRYRALDQEYQAKQDALNHEYQPTILNYIKQHIPNCAWDGTQLQFPAAA